MAAVSKPRIIRPFTPSVMVSGIPPTPKTTGGVPQAMASSITFGWLSSGRFKGQGSIYFRSNIFELAP